MRVASMIRQDWGDRIAEVGFVTQEDGIHEGEWMVTVRFTETRRDNPATFLAGCQNWDALVALVERAKRETS